MSQTTHVTGITCNVLRPVDVTLCSSNELAPNAGLERCHANAPMRIDTETDTQICIEVNFQLLTSETCNAYNMPVCLFCR